MNGRENARATGGDSPLAASSSTASGAEPIWNCPGGTSASSGQTAQSRGAPAAAACGRAPPDGSRSTAASHARHHRSSFAFVPRSRATRKPASAARSPEGAAARAALRLSAAGVSQLPPRCNALRATAEPFPGARIARAADVAARRAVLHPFADVADHVLQPECIGAELPARRKVGLPIAASRLRSTRGGSAPRRRGRRYSRSRTLPPCRHPTAAGPDFRPARRIPTRPRTAAGSAHRSLPDSHCT